MIRVMSFNIRYGLANDGENHWNQRKAFALARVQAFGPDLLGLQECRDDAQAEYVRAHLPDYAFHGIHRGGPGDTALEMAPLLYRPSALALIDAGHFWLSETPNLPGSMSWGSAYPRTASWVRLSHRATGRSLLYLNTHFDYEPAAIEGDARTLHHWLREAAGASAILLTGDFNTNKQSDAFRLLTGDTGLSDAMGLAHPDQVDAPTFHAFGVAEEMAPLDWILVSKHFQVIDVQIDRSRNGTLYPSDHYPVTAVLDWKER